MIVSDPVFGFIEIPQGLPARLMSHPYVIRLTRLKQLGPTHYVYPGAMHTRFQHSVGAMHLVEQAIGSLGKKGVCVLEEERQATMAAMLLHDLGHGPMSHCLEDAFIHKSHEEISLCLMENINAEMDGALDLAIRIFKDEYPKHFLHELVSSQLDMDRLDYLSRDSFFTGVREGNIGVARIIKMLDVINDHLVIEQKGIYTIENYLMSRRLMYWQVYLHKTSLAVQEILSLAMKRARWLVNNGGEIFMTNAMRFFLSDEKACERAEWTAEFVKMDDSDVDIAMKEWVSHPDKVLSLLAHDYINRNLFKVHELREPIDDLQLCEMRKRMAQHLGVSEEEAAYFVVEKRTNQMLYSTLDDHISIGFKDNTIHDMAELSELLSTNFTDRKVFRYYLFYQRTNPLFSPFL